MNTKIGATDGPSSEILAIENLAAAETQNGWECRGTLVFAQGREGGIASNRVGEFSWLSDREKARQERQVKDNMARAEKEAQDPLPEYSRQCDRASQAVRRRRPDRGVSRLLRPRTRRSFA